jgi:hypothetical protein
LNNEERHFVRAIGNELAMKLNEVELIFPLLMNKGPQNEKSHEDGNETHSHPFQDLAGTTNLPLLRTGSLVFLSEVLLGLKFDSAIERLPSEFYLSRQRLSLNVGHKISHVPYL